MSVSSRGFRLSGGSRELAWFFRLKPEATRPIMFEKLFGRARSAGQTVWLEGILWPRPTMLHIRTTAESLNALRDLLTTLPTPLICQHIYAYAGNDLLLERTDAFNDPVYLSERLPEAAVARFGDALGVTISQRADTA